MGESNTNPTVKPRFAYFHLTVFLSTLLSVFFFFFAVSSSFSVTSTAPLCFH